MLAGCGGGDGRPRAEVVADLERAVLADARERYAEGKPVLGATCKVARDDAGLPAGEPVLRYTCTAYAHRSNTDPPLFLGEPYVARVDFEAGSYDFCPFVPVGGEGAHTAGTFDNPPPARCAAR